VVLARRNLSRARARSALAVAAVVIGVVAIGAIGVGGEAFKQDQLDAYEGFGSTATVDPLYDTDAERVRTFDDDDISRMRRAASGATVLPVVSPRGSTVRTPAGQTLVTAQVNGIDTPGRFYSAAAGTMPDTWRRGAVVGSRLATENDIQPGDRIRVRATGQFDRSVRVVAVLEAQGFADPLNADRTVFLPLDQFETDTYDEAIVRVEPQRGSIEDAADAIEREFNGRERVLDVSPVQEQRDQFVSFFDTLNRFLLGVGAISLFVAAVTIANTLLMAAIEREGEIGLQRAVGYPKSAVLRLLVVEATLLGVIGAAIGAPIALGIGAVANQLLVGDALAFTPTGLRLVGLGVVAGVGTALVAGVYPAWKAANKRPVVALE
jgi:putative ABC transport system permease protein